MSSRARTSRHHVDRPRRSRPRHSSERERHDRPVSPPSPPTPLTPIGPDRGDRSRLRVVGDDTVYVLLGFPVALASFCVLVTLLSTAGGLLVVWVGFPLLVLTLYVAQGFANVERRRLRMRGDTLPPAVYLHPTRSRSPWKKFVKAVSDRQRWLDVVHGLVVFPIATVTWSLAIAWIAGAIGGLTAFAWAPLASWGDSTAPLEFFWITINPDHWVDGAIALTIAGVFFTVTLWPLIRGMATAQAGFAKLLLTNSRVAELQETVDQLRTRQAAVADVDVTDRQRLERDIHDGPQQRLVRLGMDLAAIERRIERDPTAAKELVAEARQQTNEALQELRNLSRGIAPPLLADRGLVVALEDLAARSAVPARFESSITATDRLPSRVEAALYFSAAEALTNVAKHAGATAAGIRLDRVGGFPARAVVAITDNGVGGASSDLGHGLAGLRHRLEALDGSLTIDSPQGGPTVLLAEVPCAL